MIDLLEQMTADPFERGTEGSPPCTGILVVVPPGNPDVSCINVFDVWILVQTWKLGKESHHFIS